MTSKEHSSAESTLSSPVTSFRRVIFKVRSKLRIALHIILSSAIAEALLLIEAGCNKTNLTIISLGNAVLVHTGVKHLVVEFALIATLANSMVELAISAVFC
jgi:hypothetical protein